MEPFLYIGLGLAVGLVIGWLWGARRAQPADHRVEAELRQLVQQREEELNRERVAFRQADAARAAAETGRHSAEQQTLEQRQQREAAEAEASRWREEHGKLKSEHATATAQLAAAREQLTRERAAQELALQAQRGAQEKAIQDLRQAFQALSLEALKATQPEFLRLATETFGKLQEAAKGDLAKRQESIAGLLKPLEESLRIYQQRLQQNETSQTSVLGEVKQHLESLAQQSQSLAAETQQFRMVLKSAPARGRWGEETLKRVTEAAGMSAHCDFDVQTGVEGQRPDLVVKLPGDRVIIVDAKVPELDFLTALDEADPLKREDALASHAAKLKATIQDLAKRDYPKLFPHALDYVVLFLPAESLFSAALEGDRDLLVWAADKRILLATPASLIALLRSVSVSWQHYDQTQNAREIAEKAREFYDRVVAFSGHFAAIGDGLGKAATAYDKAVRSYESRVRPGGERLKALGGADIHNPLPEVDAIDHNLRLLDPPPEHS